jgi:hypothetical protein
MCVCCLENCNTSGVECGKIRVFGQSSRISIAFSDYVVVYSKNVFDVKGMVYWAKFSSPYNFKMRIE